MFTNPSTGDLHLVVNSVTLANVIDQATAEANDPNDWNGNSRTVGGPTDIGADDSQSSSPSVVVGGVASPSSLATATNTAATVSLATNSDATSNALGSTSTSATKSLRTAGGSKSALRQGDRGSPGTEPIQGEAHVVWNARQAANVAAGPLEQWVVGTPEPRVATVAACGGDDRAMDHFPVNCELGCPARR